MDKYKSYHSHFKKFHDEDLIKRPGKIYGEYNSVWFWVSIRILNQTERVGHLIANKLIEMGEE